MHSLALAALILMGTAGATRADQAVTTTDPNLSTILNQNGTDQQVIQEPSHSPSTLSHSSIPQSLAEMRAYALQLVNRDRAAQGLPPLVADPLLDQVAQEHAQDMLQRGYFDHSSPEGQTPKQRFLKQGGNPRIGVGENIMYFNNPRIKTLSNDLIQMFQVTWMDSPLHRENILRTNLTGFGFGIAIGADGKQYAVQMFSLAD